jgi:hypothetical protein
MQRQARTFYGVGRINRAKNAHPAATTSGVKTKSRRCITVGRISTDVHEMFWFKRRDAMLYYKMIRGISKRLMPSRSSEKVPPAIEFSIGPIMCSLEMIGTPVRESCFD